MIDHLEFLGRWIDYAKAWMISLVGFVAWLITSDGWLRFLSVIWLIYPAYCLERWISRRNSGHARDN
jgi:hypothetical protein